MSKFKSLEEDDREVHEQVGGRNPLLPNTREFYVSAGERRIIVPLDDKLIPIRRHRLWIQNPPSTDVYSYRLTCACHDPRVYNDLEAQSCRACNGMAMGYNKTLSLKNFYHCTVICEGELLRKDKRTGQMVPTGIWDYKYLLAFDERGRQRWEETKAFHGGHLVGQRISVFRSMSQRGAKSSTPAYGDAWTVIPHQQGFQAPLTPEATDRDRWLWLRAHFYRSPAIARLMEWSQKSGSGALDHEQAVAALIKPCNYDEEFDNYSDQAADRMVAIAAGKPVDMSGGGSNAGGGYSGGALPPPPPPAMPGGGYAPPPPPTGDPYAGQTMPASSMPAYPPQYQQAAPPVGPPGGPPPVPDPVGVPPPPPAMPPAQGVTAPTGTFTGHYAPPSYPPTGAQPGQPSAPPSAGYAFDQGWTPSFPQPTGNARPAGAPVPAAQPQATPPPPAPPPIPPPPPAGVPQFSRSPF